ncbi:MAG: hypothetical protein KC708_06830 [Anaerolineae bacterium]|nr:hypothetical protein [Anaerolineae bacterium]
MMPSQFITMLLSAIIVITFTACTASSQSAVQSAAPTTDSAYDQARYERGVEVYLMNACGTCHELAAAGSRGMFAPMHSHIATVAEQRLNDSQYRGQATTVEAYIRESILQPDVFIVAEYEGSPHQMHSFADLPPEDIDALVYMLLQQR